MSTFIINLNDTIVMSDSAIVELAKVVSTCQPCVQETETNCYDVKIVVIICAAIVLVALIAKWAVWSWKRAERKAADAERKAKKIKEEEESERKIKSDLLDKYIELMKEKKTILNSEAGQEYKQVLAYLIEMSQTDKMNKITQADLLGEQKEGPSSKQSSDKS